MNPPNRLTVTLATLAIATLAGRADAVSLGQFDDFEDGTTQEWKIGASTTNPFNVATGGPAGADDNFLQYDADGSGDAGRMNFFNDVQWTGDYLSAGVIQITADVNNLSSTQPLELRLALGNATRARNGSWFASTDSISLDPGSGWTAVSFSLAQTDLTAVQGNDSYNDVLSSVAALRILSSTSPNNRGDQVTASIGIDNINAIPEPGAAALLSLTGLLLLRRRQYR